jgi:hypothetical protein
MDYITPKIYIFVLMPFSSDFDDVYELGIKAACSEAGAYCERVDEQIFEESILERVYNQISKADLLIADMTARNPNVFYEVGYAHALGKRVFLLTQKSEDIPFDLKHHPHIVYGGSISGLKTELAKRIKWAIRHPKDAERLFSTSIEVFLNAVPLVDKPNIRYRSQNYPKYPTPVIDLEIDFHNSTSKVIEPVTFQVGVIVPPSVSASFLGEDFPRQRFKLSDTSYLLLVDHKFELLPGTWDKFWLHLLAEDNQAWELGEQLEIVLRIFSRAGTQDYPFVVKCE